MRIARCGYPDLVKINGIGESTALKIAAAFELDRRKNNTNGKVQIKISCSEDTYQLVRSQVEYLNYEVFKVTKQVTY